MGSIGVFDFKPITNMEEEEIDLFDSPELVPSEVHEILDLFSSRIDSYDDCRELVKSLELVGYTCTFGLDATPYGLKKMTFSDTV